MISIKHWCGPDQIQLGFSLEQRVHAININNATRRRT